MATMYDGDPTDEELINATSMYDDAERVTAVRALYNRKRDKMLAEIVEEFEASPETSVRITDNFGLRFGSHNDGGQYTLYPALYVSYGDRTYTWILGIAVWNLYTELVWHHR